jgi:AbrB family looped-hinge helix DNA binding protein
MHAVGLEEKWRQHGMLNPMTTTIDKAGRVVIPAEVRKRLGLTAGTELELVIEGFALRLVRAVAGPQLVRRGERLVVRPRAAEGQRTEVDVARLIEEERDRWPS